MNGIIFFENGTVVPFGQLQSISKIVKAAQELLPELVKQERDQLLATITQAELKTVVERLSREEINDDSSNV